MVIKTSIGFLVADEEGRVQ